jgi:hypothetical protein
MFDV